MFVTANVQSFPLSDQSFKDNGIYLESLVKTKIVCCVVRDGFHGGYEKYYNVLVACLGTAYGIGGFFNLFESK